MIVTIKTFLLKSVIITLYYTTSYVILHFCDVWELFRLDVILRTRKNGERLIAGYQSWWHLHYSIEEIRYPFFRFLRWRRFYIIYLLRPWAAHSHFITQFMALKFSCWNRYVWVRPFLNFYRLSTFSIYFFASKILPKKRINCLEIMFFLFAFLFKFTFLDFLLVLIFLFELFFQNFY